MTTTTAQKNVPAFELFYVEERPADRHLAAIMGKTLAENAVDQVWRKVGVAFTTQGEHLSIVIGPKGDPAQRRYLAILSSHQQQAKDNVDTARLPVADLFEKDSEGTIDFKHKAGVLFLNSDESYTVIVGTKDDDNKIRYQMRRTQRSALAAPVKTDRTDAPDTKSVPEAAATEKKTVRRTKTVEAQAAASPTMRRGPLPPLHGQHNVFRFSQFACSHRHRVRSTVGSLGNGWIGDQDGLLDSRAFPPQGPLRGENQK